MLARVATSPTNRTSVQPLHMLCIAQGVPYPAVTIKRCWQLGLSAPGLLGGLKCSQPANSRGPLQVQGAWGAPSGVISVCTMFAPPTSRHPLFTMPNLPELAIPDGREEVRLNRMRGASDYNSSKQFLAQVWGALTLARSQGAAHSTGRADLVL